MTDLNSLVEMEHEDSEFVPEIIPVDSRLSLRGSAKAIQKLLDRVQSVVPSKEGSILGTEYTLITATSGDANVVEVSATDGDQTLRVYGSDIEVLKDGAVLVPGKKISAILKNAPEDLTRIDIVGNAAKILSGRAQWTVQTPTGDSLPSLPSTEGIVLHTVRSGDIVDALTVAAAAASTSLGRSSLNQVLVRNGWATGADHSRLHRMRLDGIPEHLEMQIPLKVLHEVLRLLEAHSDEAEMHMGSDDQLLVFRIGNDSIVSTRLAARFPDIEQVLLLPRMNNHQTLWMNREELMDVVKRVRVNADPDIASVMLSLVAGRKAPDGAPTWKLAVRSKDSVGNSAQESMKVSWDGVSKARDVVVNHKYLLEFLKSYPAEIIHFKLGDDTKKVRYPLYVENDNIGFIGFVQQMGSAY